MLKKSILKTFLPTLSAAIALLFFTATFAGCGDGMRILFEKDKSSRSEKEVTSYIFEKEKNPVLLSDAVGIINETTISVLVPEGTVLTILTPTIEYIGCAISPNTGIPTDFSDPVVYTVSAIDNTTMQYTVYVTSAPKIISITSTTVEGYYKADNNINITISFCCPVYLSGVLEVLLNTGASVPVSGDSPSSVFTGTYIVSPGENTNALDAIDIVLSSGTILDEFGNGATFEIPDTTITDSKTIAVDTVPPEVTIAPESTITKETTFEATITFSEAVAGFNSEDILITNGDIADPETDFTEITPGQVYTAVITPEENKTVMIAVNAGKAADTAGNGNTAALQKTVTHDIISPVAVITGPSGVNSPEFDITITFDEDVTGFIDSDVSVTNGSVTGFSSGSASVYSATISTGSEGDVTVQIPADSASDAAGNGNTISDPKITVYYTDNPTLTITSSESSPTNADPISVTFTFSTSVTGFDESEILVTNGTVQTGSLSGSGAEYTANIIPVHDSVITVEVPAGVAIDGSSNGNLTASFIITHDGTPPDLNLISTVEPDPTTNSPFYITVDFSEDVDAAQLTADDFTVTNCAITDITPATGYNNLFTLEITPVSDGLIEISGDADATTDRAGNLNIVSASALSLNYSGYVTEILRPDADTAYKELYPVDPHYPLVSDSNDETFFWYPGTWGGVLYKNAIFEIDDPTLDNIISKIEVFYRVRINGPNLHNAKAKPVVKTDLYDPYKIYYGTEYTISEVNQWLEYSYVWQTHPDPAQGGRQWNKTDIKNLQTGITVYIENNTESDLQCSEVWVEVYYTP